MKHNSFISEVILSAIMVVLLVILAHPFSQRMTMTMSTLTTTNIVLVVVFAVFASFIWKERARDERESLHRLIAGRVGFLTGAAILLLGIVIQSFHGNLDNWLVIGLLGMIIGKIAGSIYGRLTE